MTDPSSGAPPPPRFATRLALFYGALFLVYGIQLPYLTLWLDTRGLTAAEIGLATALPMIVRLVATPGVAVVADQYGWHRGLVIALSAGALAAALVLLVSGSSVWVIVILVTVLLVAAQSTMPLAETIAMSGVRSARLDYGRMRLWGSLTFVAANLAGGWLIARSGAEPVALLLAGSLVLTLLAALALPSPVGGATAAAPSHGARPEFSLAGLGALMRDRRIGLLLLATGAIQASHAVYYVFGTLHWRAQGIDAGWFGTLWAIGVLLEIALFSVSGAAVARVGAIGLLLAGGLAAVVRWGAMALDPPLAVLIGLQMLHGITFGATHLGAMHLIAALAPDRQAGTAQALHTTVTAGVAMGAASYLAGQIYGALGGTSYLAMAALAALGLAAVAGLALSPRTPAPAAG